MPRITDKSFVYIPSFDTDLKKKFKAIIARERAFQKAREEAEKEDADRASQSSVVPMRKAAK